jgi:hypothetical protein
VFLTIRYNYIIKGALQIKLGGDVTPSKQCQRKAFEKDKKFHFERREFRRNLSE